VPIAFGQFVAALQFFVVVGLNPYRLADLVDDVLIRRRVIAAGCFVADRFGIFPVGVDIASGHGRSG
jgi:hypothetical protein